MIYNKITLIFFSVLCSVISSAQNGWTHFSQSNSPLPENSVRSIAFANDSAVWIGTDYGLAKLNDTIWTIYHTFNTNGGLPDDAIRCITIDSNNIKWIGTLSGGLTRFDDSTWTTLNTLNSPLPDDYVRDIKFDQSGNTWIATTNGLVKIDTAQIWTNYNTLNSSFASDNIARIFIDPDNNDKITGTVNGGLNIINDSTITTYTIANSAIPDNSILDIDKDVNGNYWMASPANGLIAKVAGGGWYNLNASAGYPSSGLTSLKIADNGDIWTGSVDSGIIRKSGLQYSVWNSLNSPLADNYIQCIAFAPDGKLWIGTQSAGVYVMDVSLITVNYEISSSTFITYPNPVTDHLFVFGDFKNDLQLQLVDVEGRCQKVQVEKLSIENYLIDLKNISAGIYLLNVYDNSGKYFSKKIIKIN